MHEAGFQKDLWILAAIVDQHFGCLTSGSNTIDIVMYNVRGIFQSFRERKVGVRWKSVALCVRLSFSGFEESDSRGWQAVRCCVTIQEGALELRGTSLTPRLAFINEMRDRE